MFFSVIDWVEPWNGLDDGMDGDGRRASPNLLRWVSTSYKPAQTDAGSRGPECRSGGGHTQIQIVCFPTMLGVPVPVIDLVLF